MSEKIPKVSVVIPTYNRAHLIERAIRSVLNQTYQDFEIIVVDDGSTDNTEEVVKRFNDPRIRYIKHEKNRGGAAARNTGIKAARGKYIAFQDSDDEWLPEKLKRQMQVFESAPAEVGVVYTGFWRVEGSKKTYNPQTWVKKKEGDLNKELLKGNFIGLPTIIVKKECFNKAGMFCDILPRLQDWELLIRLSKFCTFKFISKSLLVSSYTPNSISANQDALIKSLKIILSKHFDEFKKDKKTLSKHIYWIGSLLCQMGKIKKGREYLFKSLKYNPLFIKNWTAILLSFLGSSLYKKVVSAKNMIENLRKT